jgi:Glutaredoxin and related proteins
MSQHTLLFFGLTTCVHCKHTRQFLEKHNLPFDCVYVDTLEGDERSQTLKTVREYNPRVSFPTLVVDGGKEVIVGFRPDAITKALEL